MICYFHLVSANDFLRDDTGCRVTDFADAWRQATQAVREFCDEMDDDELGGTEEWTITVCDGSGNLLFSMPVTREAEVRLAA